MKRTLILTILFFILNQGFAQIGINTNDPDTTSAVLDISSDSKGLLIPRLDTTARKGLGGQNPADGVLVYDSQIRKFYVWNKKAGNWDVINPWFLQKDEFGVGGNMFIPDTIAEKITIGGDLDILGELTFDGNSFLPNAVLVTDANSNIIGDTKNSAHNKSFASKEETLAGASDRVLSPERLHDHGDWINLTSSELQDDWTCGSVSNPEYYYFQYRKLSTGQIEIRGQIFNGPGYTGANQSIIYVLPEEYRPIKRISEHWVNGSSSIQPQTGLFFIYPDGIISIGIGVLPGGGGSGMPNRASFHFIYSLD